MSQEVDVEAVAVAYFRSLLGAICRAIPANCNGDFNADSMSREIQQFMKQLYGLVILQTEQGPDIETEFNCYTADCPLPLIQEIISGQRLVDPDDSIILLSPETLAEIDPVQYEVMSQVQEESQLKDVLAAANIALSGVASSRKARKHRSTVGGDALEDSLKEITVNQAPVDFLPLADASSLLTDLCKDRVIFGQADAMNIDVPVTTRPEIIKPTEDDSLAKKMEEYEVLLTWMKVLSQPDEAILKKISVYEEYEERMRKLGTKLKHSLSPEDLIKTLASIQPAPAPQ